MQFLLSVVFALIACVSVSQSSYLAPAPAVVAYAPPRPIYAPAYIPTIVKTGTTHHAIPVTEHRYTETRYETPGAQYAIPAVATYTVTRPGYTTYLQSAITKAHVTNHLVAGPTVVKPVLQKAYVAPVAPVAPAPYW